MALNRPMRPADMATSAGSETADVQRAREARPGGSLRLADIGFRILVNDRDAGVVPGLERGEGDRQLMTFLQASQAPEVSQALAFLLGHVIAVRQVGRS